jgi:hypothetical protein
MNIKEICLSSPIEEKIAWANDCHKKFGNHLEKDRAIVVLLDKLKTAIQDSHREMVKIGIDNICRECEENEGGSCCGIGLENRYDVWLLLINLLLGVTLPAKRRDPESCFFLGKTGCLLLARHVICINYVCNSIANRIDLQEMNVLRGKEGEELNVLFLLQERIKTMSFEPLKK